MKHKEDRIDITDWFYHPENYLRVKQYAKLKDISPWYVRKLCRLGKVTCVMVEGVWFIKKNINQQNNLK